ncbi:PREDICTED: uncharacterized protein LOC104732162 isoform X1 [Camelina sativa]|uniref:Uncharacterized protein LOC104732162 isoform X1 n=1 Tax=Camelina sativa TaxID=90675 RepID=A0ABM0V2Y2_CAMSA|nr:PREDICTED: uncharacterized protein LOC104732162 isoform X1 [Camelina sativa]
MACLRNKLCLVAGLLLIYQKTVTCDFLSPLLAPMFDNVCNEVECGKGKCKASSNTTFMYECECEDGWKQFDHNLKFLPCIAPNCSFDLTCGEAASPAQPKTPPKDNNTSFFDACHWVDCGGGSCNKTTAFAYSCDCRDGYQNLMNITTFPCFKNCALGMDCLNLDIPLSNSSSSSSPPALPDSSKNQAAGLNLRGSSLWWITFLLCVSLAPWRLLYV